ncbi:MAG: EscR/YscR/HrcR family type III secretion system export apparatus protein [Deltaproteobacteria bacterium]|nr:EscR/YscR/HrcR family type III secretion system export apparatus protein [Deltaproteobacteria bacterium]
MTASALVAAAAPSPWIEHLGVTALLILVPFVIIAGTSFAKIALVLGILRSALGAPGVPPASVLTAVSVVLSMFVMAPVASEISTSLPTASPAAAAPDPYGIAEARVLYDAASPPLVRFMEANTPRSEIDFFLGLAGEPKGAKPSFTTLLAAFTVNEIAEAFLIGFLVFLPFLVVDLIVANVLLALGLQAMSPTSVSLPLKLLLIVSVGGWRVIASGLVVGYGY